MLDIRSELKTYLEAEDFVEKVALMKSTTDAINNMEKVVFNNTALMVGDADVALSFFSHAYRLVGYNIDVVFMIKSDTYSVTILSDLINLLEAFVPSIDAEDIHIKSDVKNITPSERFNDKTNYIVLTVNITQMKKVV